MPHPMFEDLLQKQVSVITTDGKVYVGRLECVDGSSNLGLSHVQERIFTTTGSKSFPFGILLIRGDNVVVVGEINETIDDQINLESIRAKPLKPITF